MGSCCDDDCSSSGTPPGKAYRIVLWIALAINLGMFAVEVIASIISGSVSLQADALDFLGDAANYAVAVLVAGMALRWRASAALLKGVVMGMFAFWVAGSTFYYALLATVPRAEIMSGIGVVAFVANMSVAVLLYRFRESDSQALSVWLCTRNDAIVNLAVIAAGAGVWASGTHWPDIAVAAVIAALGLSSAVRVVRSASKELLTIRNPSVSRA